MTFQSRQTASFPEQHPVAERPDGIASTEFRGAMAALAASVCVVTAGKGKARQGRTVTAAFSLSIDPPTILVSIDAHASLAALMHEEQEFSFAQLSEKQQGIADAFAGKVVPEKRFDEGNWSQWPSGTPCLFDAVTTFDCEVTAEIDLSGHRLFAGRIRSMILDNSLPPLIWHQRRYTSVLPG
ncbi:flavin reductase family protein [Cohaesibacter haloalkalitolerans]|uniref:flavin reductase family protein n=1 Tax=Cohaesibacter haloalkalitolerans TaxID=1162980 RepID=UPI000E649889|nr:flavin reductase family protein [Cohaesibacter haloalkalitolerans]